MKIIVIFISVLILNGCAQTSGIVNAENTKSFFEDAVYEGRVTYNSEKILSYKKYRLFNKAATGNIALSTVKNDVTLEAKNYCFNNKVGNKRMLVISERESVPPHLLGNFPRYELVFSCIPQEDEPLFIQDKNLHPKPDKYDNLLKLKTLYDKGILTQEEYEKEKNKLLK
jgi:hypothetical protein